MQQSLGLNQIDIIKFLLRNSLWAIVVAVAAGIIAFQFTQNQDPVFDAQATVVASQARQSQDLVGQTILLPPPVDASVYRIAARSEPVLAQALISLGVAEPSQRQIRIFRNKFDIHTVETDLSNLILVKAVGDTAGQATDRANALAQALVDWDKQRARDNFDRVIIALEEQLTALDGQVRTLQVSGETAPGQIDGILRLRAERQNELDYARVLSVAASGRLELLEAAVQRLGPTSPRPSFNATVAAVLGLALAYGLLGLRRMIDSSLRSAVDLERVSGLPVLVEFSKIRRGMRRLPREAADYLRTNLLLELDAAQPQIILVTSSKNGEGKSSVAMNLAESFARGKYKTLLVDASLRQPVIGDEYKLSYIHDVSLEYLLGEESVLSEEGKNLHAPTGVNVGNDQVLDVIPSFKGSDSPTDLLSRNFRRLLDGWAKQYDAIVIDSPPVHSVADPLIIAPLCTGTILVANLTTTTRQHVRTTVDLLQRVGVNLVGIVATQVAKPARTKFQQPSRGRFETENLAPKRVNSSTSVYSSQD